MASHGGSRSGAGRPKGGVSQLNRIMRAAITKGMAHAGREKYGGHVTTSDDNEAAAITGAMIISDMIQNGQGSDVLKLAAVIQTKDTGDNTEKSTLEDSLNRLPALSCDTFMSTSTESQKESADTSTTYGEGSTDTESGAPVLGGQSGSFFAPQQSLMIDVPASESQPAASRQAPPTPPGAPTHISIDLDPENFEKTEQADPEFDLPVADQAGSRS